jgi:hypothetical protein
LHAQAARFFLSVCNGLRDVPMQFFRAEFFFIPNLHQNAAAQKFAGTQVLPFGT